MDHRGPSSLQQSSLQQSSLQPSSLTTLATRAVNTDIPGAVAGSLSILRNGGVGIVADQLRITAGVSFHTNPARSTNAVITTYADTGETRIVVCNSILYRVDATLAQDWVDLLGRGTLPGLTRAGSWVIFLTPATSLTICSLWAEDVAGVKIVRHIIAFLEEQQRTRAPH
jgi:hypothetical protein